MRITYCEFPDDLLYDVDYNVWVRFEGEVATVGVDSILAWISGAFTSVSFKETGPLRQRGHVVAAVEGMRHFDVVRAPLTGIVVGTNTALLSNPKLVNKDPYGAGWMAKIKPAKKDAEIDLLQPISLARTQLEKKVSELRIRCFEEYPDQDLIEIGVECSASIAKLDEMMGRMEKGGVVHLVSDDPTASIELIRWSERSGNTLAESRKEDNLQHFIIKKTT